MTYDQISLLHPAVTAVFPEGPGLDPTRSRISTDHQTHRLRFQFVLLKQ